ncbi:hypothetical protein [Kribbella lupini]|uniref:Uncharacterized protein n=1 Tax=Kribbella lupini TaxID=291602 RepID=A0ABN2AVV6_9ACTN
MEYEEFDAERMRVVRAWGVEITDAEVLAAEALRLRELAETVEGERDRDRARRYLVAVDQLVEGARTPTDPALVRASEVLQRAADPAGTPDERRARAEAGMAEIGRIADEAPSDDVRHAVLMLNGTLAEILDVLEQA